MTLKNIWRHTIRCAAIEAFKIIYLIINILAKQ